LAILQAERLLLLAAERIKYLSAYLAQLEYHLLHCGIDLKNQVRIRRFDQPELDHGELWKILVAEEVTGQTAKAL